MTDQANAAQTIAAEFTQAIAGLKLAQDSRDEASILAWDNGLCVGFKDGKSFACNILVADVVGTPAMPEEAWAFTPIIVNGHNERAQVVRRQAEITRQISRLEGHLETLRARGVAA